MYRLTLLALLSACLALAVAEDTEDKPTTYDWGKHTGSTFDWGKYTSTRSPNNDKRTTYDWGKHTGTTYDWGKHTSTTEPSNTTDHDDNHHDDDNHDNQYRCGSGKYSCAGTVGMCIELTSVCDTKIDCPNGDDENPKVCHFHQDPNHSNKKNANRFSGTGFMFNIRRLKIRGGSQAKLFNQDSDNTIKSHSDGM